MNVPEYREALERFIRAEAKPAEKFSHQARLFRLAVELAEGKAFDDDVLHAAAWLHDLGVFIGHRPEEPLALAKWDHIAYVSAKAPEILQRLAFPAGKIPPVLEVIRTHLPSLEPTSFEGTLLRDADILEQLGAVGILRTVSKVGRDTRFIRFDDALHALRKNLDELPGKLRLDSTRRRAEPRLRVLRAFLDGAGAEAGGVAW